MLIPPPSTGGVEENSIEKGIHEMLNREQIGTRSLTSLDSIDKKGLYDSKEPMVLGQEQGSSIVD